MHAAFLVLLGLVAQVDSSPAVAADNGPREVVVAVCPAEFRAAFAPWVIYRTNQGYDVRVISNKGNPKEIRRRIRQAVPEGQPKFLVLVGDVPTGMNGKPIGRLDKAARARCVPAPYAKAKVNVHWGSEPLIPNDAWYADWDDDRVPDVAQGRLTADTPDDLKTMIEKIIAYERSTDFRPWRRKLNFVAGVGGFGAMADMAIESATRFMLTSGIPADRQVSMTQANWRAVYCPDPRKINQTTIDRLNDGAMFWAYIGHSGPRRLATMRVPGGQYPLLNARDVARLHADGGPSIALFLACYVGAIDGRFDCLGEELLRQKGGPVGVVAGSRVNMPYAMAVMGMDLMDACFRRHAPTLGEAVLSAKRSLVVVPKKKTPVRTMIDSIASLVSPNASNMADERAEHVVLFNLLGDPCLRLRHPQAVKLDVVFDENDPTKVVVKGDSPLAGRATVELVRPLGQLGFRPPRRSKYPNSPDELAEFDKIYKKANDGQISSAKLQVTPGPFQVELKVPEGLVGKFPIRVFIEGKDGFGSGAAELHLKKQEEQPAVGSGQ